jgi:tripartite-type tricarboxylate transporter receptor subunit TctC
LVSSVAQAKDIPIITRFDDAAPTMQVLRVYVSELNLSQNKYNFIVNSVPGALGENADRRSLNYGQENLWFGTTASFSVNKYEFKDSWDRENAFTFLVSRSNTAFFLYVNHDVKDVADLVTRLKSKNKVYYGSTTAGGTFDLLSNVFIKQNNIKTAMETIRYKSNGELYAAAARNEIDFLIATVGPNELAKPILLSKNESIPEYNVPTGKQLNIEDYYYQSSNFFATPSQYKEFATDVKQYLNAMCFNKKIKEMMIKMNQEPTCYNSDQIKQIIQKEDSWVQKYLVR